MKFIEIESRHGTLFYINIAAIACIYRGDKFTIVEFVGEDEHIETFESYEDIKKKVEDVK